MIDDDFGIQFSDDVDVVCVRHLASDHHVTEAARVSTFGSSRNYGSTVSDEGLIRYLMQNRHGSPFEHTSMTFLVSAPIFVWREHMRHRAGISYNEESGRYRHLEPRFYLPNRDRALVQVGKAGAYTFTEGTSKQYDSLSYCFEEACLSSYSHYLEMLEAGIAREVARMVLPVNIYSGAYVTFNARSLMHFLSLRVKSATSKFPSYPQREIEMVAEKYEQYLAAFMPMTYAAFVENGRVSP